MSKFNLDGINGEEQLRRDMRFPNKYLRNIKPYKLASHAIWSVNPDKREEVLKLDWNEATVAPSPLVKQRIEELLTQPDFFHLYPVTHNELLLKRIADYVGLPEENVQYFASSDALHEYICKVFIGVGDPVMILSPSYDNFRLTCQANGADVFFSEFNADFTFDAKRFEADILAKEPAVVYICNPNNPTGYCHSVEYIEHLLQTFPDTLFLVDEAYSEFSGVTAKDLVLKYDNLLISRTMSKAFALANFRFGYLIASKENVQFVNRIRNPKNISTITQTAAQAALEDVDYMRTYVFATEEGKKWFIEEMKCLPQIHIHMSYGNFLLVQFGTYEEKIRLIQHLASKNIFVRDTMQSPIVRNCFRITCGTKKQMKQVAEEIKSFYA